MDSSQYLRCDCSDGRYKDLHIGWATDHVVSLPGPVPILASSEDRLDFVLGGGPASASIRDLRTALMASLGTMIALKGIRTLRLYTHDDCGLYERMLGHRAQLSLLEEELEVAVRRVKRAFPEVCVKGHVVCLSGGVWTVERPLVVLR